MPQRPSVFPVPYASTSSSSDSDSDTNSDSNPPPKKPLNKRKRRQKSARLTPNPTFGEVAVNDEVVDVLYSDEEQPTPNESPGDPFKFFAPPPVKATKGDISKVVPLSIPAHRNALFHRSFEQPTSEEIPPAGNGNESSVSLSLPAKVMPPQIPQFSLEPMEDVSSSADPVDLGSSAETEEKTDDLIPLDPPALSPPQTTDPPPAIASPERSSSADEVEILKYVEHEKAIVDDKGNCESWMSPVELQLSRWIIMLQRQGLLNGMNLQVVPPVVPPPPPPPPPPSLVYNAPSVEAFSPSSETSSSPPRKTRGPGRKVKDPKDPKKPRGSPRKPRQPRQTSPPTQVYVSTSPLDGPPEISPAYSQSAPRMPMNGDFNRPQNQNMPSLPSLPPGFPFDPTLFAQMQNSRFGSGGVNFPPGNFPNGFSENGMPRMPFPPGRPLFPPGANFQGQRLPCPWPIAIPTGMNGLPFPPAPPRTPNPPNQVPLVATEFPGHESRRPDYRSETPRPSAPGQHPQQHQQPRAMSSSPQALIAPRPQLMGSRTPFPRPFLPVQGQSPSWPQPPPPPPPPPPQLRFPQGQGGLPLPAQFRPPPGLEARVEGPMQCPPVMRMSDIHLQDPRAQQRTSTPSSRTSQPEAKDRDRDMENALRNFPMYHSLAMKPPAPYLNFQNNPTPTPLPVPGKPYSLNSVARNGEVSRDLLAEHLAMLTAFYQTQAQAKGSGSSGASQEPPSAD